MYCVTPEWSRLQSPDRFHWKKLSSIDLFVRQCACGNWQSKCQVENPTQLAAYKKLDDPSVTLTRFFFITWFGIPRGV